MFLLAEVFFTVESGLLLLTVAILVGPILAERLRIPGLVGLIFVGMVFGPFVLGWMASNGFVAAVGAAGLLYLMFLAGVELDMATFQANRKAAITFGLLTFVIPFGISFLYGLNFLGFGVVGASLIGAMWASHTIVAYPEAKAAGLDKNRAIGSAVAATVITDVLALIVLAISSSADNVGGEAGGLASAEEAPLSLWVGIVILVFFTLWLLPRITRWLFLRVGSRSRRFIIVLAGMSAGAVVSLLGGIEGLVGAFLAGIGINRLIPARSELMERIEFFGSSLFVPAFLISVGLSIDPAALVQLETIKLALIFTALVVVGKVLAAVISGKLFGFSNNEIGVLAALTIGQAAATLAIAQVGVETGIFDQDILNAAVLTVVFTVLVTSFGTRFFARRIEAPEIEVVALGSHVLVNAPQNEDTQAILAVAARVASRDGGLVSPYVVGVEGDKQDDTDRLERSVHAVTNLGQDSEGIIRRGTSLAGESHNLSLEVGASLLLLPWEGPQWVPGVGIMLPERRIDEIGLASPIPTAAAAVRTSEWARIFVFTGRYSSVYVRREDVTLAIDLATALRADGDDKVLVYTSDPRGGADLKGENVTISEYAAGSDQIFSELGEGDLVVIPPHVAQIGRGFAVKRVSQIFSKASLIVIGGPGRLSLSRQETHRMNLGVAPSRVRQ